MHLSPPVAWAAVRSKAVVLLLLIVCLSLLPLWESVIVICFVVRYFMYILVLQSATNKQTTNKQLDKQTIWATINNKSTTRELSP